MKYIQRLLPLTVLIAAFLLSCTKSSNDYSFITGKWKVIIDSVYSQFGSDSGRYQIYQGVTGDYWDFRSNNHIYINEGPIHDTLDYIIIPPNTIEITSFDFVHNEGLYNNTTTQSANTLTVKHGYVDFDGTYNRTILLSR